MAVINFKSDNRISAKHREFLREHCTSLDNDLAQLARDLGLKVFEEELMPYEDGFITYDPTCGSSSGFKIVINEKQSLERKRFSVAHEIAHFVLHRKDVDALKDQVERMGTLGYQPKLHRVQEWDTLGFYYESPSDKIMEAEANIFASNLLMPANFFRPAYFRLDGDTFAIAKLFLVSQAAVLRRITELRLY